MELSIQAGAPTNPQTYYMCWHRRQAYRDEWFSLKFMYVNFGFYKIFFGIIKHNKLIIYPAPKKGERAKKKEKKGQVPN